MSWVRSFIIFFSKLANDWWDEEGSMSFLHSMSEIRTKYIKDSKKDNRQEDILEGLIKAKKFDQAIKLVDNSKSDSFSPTAS